VVAVVALVLFGSKRIPELFKGIGQGIKEFKKASSDVSNEFNTATTEAPQQRPQAPAPAPLPAPTATVTQTPSATVPKS